MPINDAEYYFIQLLFCKNRDLLRQESRELYDALFLRYEKIYQEGIKQHIDISLINSKFIATLFGKKANANRQKGII